MAIHVLLFLAALTVRGEMAARLESAVLPADSGRSTLELSYEIPYSSLSFVRSGEAYVATYRLALEALDRSGQPVASDIRRNEVVVVAYGVTGARDSMAHGVMALELPAGAVSGRVRITDPASDRSARADFRIERPSGGMSLRLARAGAGLVMLKADTLRAQAELVPAVAGFDSCRFVVLEGRRRALSATVATTESAGRRIARYSLSLGDSAGRAVLASGDYQLEASWREARARLPFSVRVAFFDDDRAWARRVDQLVYITGFDQMRRLKAVAPSEREQAWRDFWRAFDLSPTTERNEREEEYFERIDHAEENFGRGDRGYRSDRGRVYVVLGPPDQVEQRPFELNAPAVEIWYYYSIGKTFTFYDRFGSGQMVLANPEALDGR